ncbi:TOPRIM nucleotidyl transferase/hydrolase domain-containing protein [Rheinheimera sp.]|mgnify:CR=1 FL=1|uniref:TOPRIM nucleotidyl transferase/hydrolase domain-containing protein n=1 Tax=Rheinheimera sp. TaxID=1869214 RepID=UPI002FDD2CE4
MAIHFYSLKREKPNNWIICEGITEKIYLEHFLKDVIARLNLRILPMGGSKNVTRLYEYLKTPIREDDLNGKVFCLVDTDNVRPEDIGNGSSNLVIKRFNNSGTTQQTALVNLNHGEMYLTDVERSLNPLVFRETINELAQDDEFKVTSIENESGNSDFIHNFRNTYIQDFFKINEGANKIIFAKKYVEKEIELREVGNSTNLTPKWVSTIVELFDKKSFV